MDNRKQLTVLGALLIAYALSAFLVYVFFIDQITVMAGNPVPDMGVSKVVLGLTNAGIVIVVYGLLGLAGYWFARKLKLPGIFSEDGNWRRWFIIPMILGLVCGVLLVIADLLFASVNGIGRFPHPAFPASILASLSAGIGEEIMFRGFVFGLWGLLLNWLLKRLLGRMPLLSLWVANLIAALAFGAGHIGTAVVLTGASSPAQLNPVLLAEIFLLNGLIGVIAGERYMKDGLVAAVGVHFWTDVVFHVIWGSF